MTTIDTILKPFKFVENEVESVVAKVYDVYHDKTGGDQYGLSNFYILNATIFGAAARYSESASAIETVEEAAIITAVSAIHYFNNNQNRKYDKELSNLEQLAKHPQREASRVINKMIGRSIISIISGSMIYKALEYSNIIQANVEAPVTMPELLTVIFSSLLTFSMYTSAIDLNKPPKSKLASKVKEMMHIPNLTTAGIKN